MSDNNDKQVIRPKAGSGYNVDELVDDDLHVRDNVVPNITPNDRKLLDEAFRNLLTAKTLELQQQKAGLTQAKTEAGDYVNNMIGRIGVLAKDYRFAIHVIQAQERVNNDFDIKLLKKTSPDFFSGKEMGTYLHHLEQYSKERAGPGSNKTTA
jgi:hypothetical protein